ncbi:MAG: type VI secretion system ATPase TssH [Candidatus Korobacteraceae bacterium]|jgi:type VI secretion system protein VasG
MASDWKSLIQKLNTPTREILEGALQVCRSRTNYDADLPHYLTKALEREDLDFARIAKAFSMNKSVLMGDLSHALDLLKRGSGSNPLFSPALLRLFRESWVTGTLSFGAAEIRTGFTIYALVSDEELLRYAREISREFLKINAEQLKTEFYAIVAGSIEDRTTKPMMSGAAAGGQSQPGAHMGSKSPNLDQFTVNLNDKVKAGKIDPVLGRDMEIRQVIDILMRRRQNNPILTGEAGVGKTAVVEGFAQRVVSGDVPEPLRKTVIRTLDLALLQAGASVKGEFEDRLKGIIEECKASPVPIILFIDEAHTMIGAGGAAGQGDAAQLLKPALARGELRTIAATTWSEYKKYFEKDAALARRFQVVKVDEPSVPQCEVMLRGIVANLEKHHNLRILDEAVNSAVKLSARYLAGRQLPDKAVSVLDTACARLALGQAAKPAAVEDIERRIDDLATQQRILEREVVLGANHSERLQKIVGNKQKLEEELTALRERWEKERTLVEQVRALQAKIEQTAAQPAAAAPTSTVALPDVSASDSSEAVPATDQAAMKSELLELEHQLKAIQADQPLMGVCVDAEVVGEVISGWTGIPTGKMVKDEIAAVLKLDDYLATRIIGQDHALKAIGQRVVTSRASLDDPSKPIGVFMLVGPSGVGKTETALALSELFYGGERNLITINMSEFQEAHTVSTLKGSPPGYVGYGEGGVLTEAVRRRPYSVVLLDEVEKAHPDVLELFYQVFDKGHMEDGEGREIDFKNTIILLTTNACTETLMKLCADPETTPGPAALVNALKPELNKIFKPAFLGRMLLLPYFPIRDESMKKIIVLKLSRVQKRLAESHGITLQFGEELIDEIARRCTEVESGARNVDNILTNTLLPEISRQLLQQLAEGTRIAAIQVGLDTEGSFTYEFAAPMPEVSAASA